MYWFSARLPGRKTRTHALTHCRTIAAAAAAAETTKQRHQKKKLSYSWTGANENLKSGTCYIHKGYRARQIHIDTLVGLGEKHFVILLFFFSVDNTNIPIWSTCCCFIATSAQSTRPHSMNDFSSKDRDLHTYDYNNDMNVSSLHLTFLFLSLSPFSYRPAKRYYILKMMFQRIHCIHICIYNVDKCLCGAVYRCKFSNNERASANIILWKFILSLADWDKNSIFILLLYIFLLSVFSSTDVRSPFFCCCALRFAYIWI